MKRVVKGNYGYLAAKTKQMIFRTILLFGISLAIFIMGYVTTKTKQNLLTIVAVLGCLPASKSAVNMIMFLRVKGCSEDAYKQIDAVVGNLSGAYDLIFTSYEKTFQVAHVTVEGKNICGYTESAKCDTSLCEKHITTLLQQNGKSDYTVKIFRELPKYVERLNQLNKLHDSEKAATEILTFLYEITL